MSAEQSRIFSGPDGVAYRARVVPREIPSGISRRVNSIVFETVEGEWIGAAPLYAAFSLDELTPFQLSNLLQEARLRG